MRATTDAYDGIPYEDLPIETIDWERRGEYIRTRSTRKGGQELDVEPEWATEATRDPGALVGPGRSRSGETVRVVGFSSGAGRLLTVLLIGTDTPVSGEWEGVNAWAANDRDERDYARLNHGED